MLGLKPLTVDLKPVVLDPSGVSYTGSTWTVVPSTGGYLAKSLPGLVSLGIGSLLGEFETDEPLTTLKTEHLETFRRFLLLRTTTTKPQDFIRAAMKAVEEFHGLVGPDLKEKIEAFFRLNPRAPDLKGIPSLSYSDKMSAVEKRAFAAMGSIEQAIKEQKLSYLTPAISFAADASSHCAGFYPDTAAAHARYIEYLRREAFGL